MITDNVTWLYGELRKNNAVFIRNIMGGVVHLIAANRAARRVLYSNRIKNIAKTKGATIEDNYIF